MNKKTPIVIALILGVLIGLLVVTIATNSDGPKRIAITTPSAGITFSDETWERLEKALDAWDFRNWP